VGVFHELLEWLTPRSKCERPKQIFVLPPEKAPTSLVICSLSQASCSILLCGEPEKLSHFQIFLESLFEKTFSHECPEHPPDENLYEIAWNRFHQLPINPRLWRGVREDMGAILFGVFSVSVTMEYDVGDIVGLGGFSNRRNEPATCPITSGDGRPDDPNS
jgi:hypothetical protein